MSDNENIVDHKSPLQMEKPPKSPVMRLSAYLFLLLIVLVAVATFGLLSNRHERLAAMKITSVKNSAILEQNLTGVVNLLDLSLRSCADEVTHQLRTGGVVTNRLDSFLQEQFSHIPMLDSLRISDADGNVWIGSGKVALKPVSMGDRDYFKRLKMNRDSGLEISKPLQGKISGKNVLVFARRINAPDGSFYGVVYAVIQLESIRELLDHISIGSHGEAMVYDEDREVISFVPQNSTEFSVVKELPPYFRSLGDSGELLARKNPDSMERYYSYRRVKGYPLFVSDGISTDDALYEWRSEFWMTVGFTALCFVVAVTIIAFVSRRWKESVKGYETNFALLALSEERRSSIEKYKMEIQENDIMFSKFMKYSPIQCYIKEFVNGEIQVLRASDNFYDMIGLSPEKMLGKSMHELFPKEFADKITADDISVLKEKKVVRMEESLSGGSYITYKFPIEIHQGKSLLAGYTIDITPIKFMEMELRHSHDFLQSVMDALTQNLCIIDHNGVILGVNAAWMKFANENGCKESKVSIGVNYFEICKNTSGNDHEMAMEMYNGMNSVLEGKILDYYQEYPCHSPSEQRWFGVRVTRFTQNNHFVLVTSHENITERKNAEEGMQQIQLQMLQNDKMATIGQLAAGVAHEINNPMAFIGSNMTTLYSYVQKYIAYIETLEKSLKSESDGKLPEDVAQIYNSLKLNYVNKDIFLLLQQSNEGVEHIKQIVLDLKTFARADVLKTVAADINECLNSTLNIVHNELKYFANVVKNYGEIPKVVCNVQQINQVILNLLVNASHAIQGTEKQFGDIVITTWQDGEFVCFSVADTGCGIPADMLSKIFDAFYTTKDVGKGTGLGLSISAEIVRKHGGEMTVQSEVGVGTIFIVKLPIKKI